MRTATPQELKPKLREILNQWTCRSRWISCAEQMLQMQLLCSSGFSDGTTCILQVQKAGSGPASGTHLLPQGLKRSTNGVDARPLSGVGQQPPGLLDGLDLWTSLICIDPGPFPGRLLEAEAVSEVQFVLTSGFS